MSEKFKDVVARNARAAEDLDRALRDCISAIKDDPNSVVEGRFRVVSGGKDAQIRRAGR